MTIKQLIRSSHSIAIKSGFWTDKCIYCKGKGKIKTRRCSTCGGAGEIPKDRNNAEMIALMHSELSEALEALRKDDWKEVAEELADVIIRIADFAGGKNIDLEEEIQKKIKKNKKRAWRHGKKF